MAVLLIEHNIDMIIDVCDRVMVLDFGKEIARGVPHEVRRNTRVLQAYMGETLGDEREDETSDLTAPALEDRASV